MDLLEQEIVSATGISWAIYKSAPYPRQPHQHPTTQFFTGQMPPSTLPINSVKAIKTNCKLNKILIFFTKSVIELICDAPTPPHTHNHFTALWILSETTRVSWYQKKHSSTHTHCGHQSSHISFLQLLRSMASSLFNLRA